MGAEQTQSAPPEPTKSISEDSNASEDDDSEPEFLDLLVAGEQGFDQLTEIAQRITTATEVYSSEMRESTEKIKHIVQHTQPQKLAQSTFPIIKQAAKNLDAYAHKLEAEVPLFRSSYSIAMTAFGRAAALVKAAKPEEDEQIRSARDVVASIRKTMADSSAERRNFRDTIAGTVPPSSDYRKAKRRGLAALDALDSEFTVAENLAREVEAVLGSLLD
jgi:hypothetical protein